MIREIIVVEGRDDEAAVRRAVEADTSATHGYGIRQETLDRLARAYETRGLVLLLDPDRPGEEIRRKLSALFPNAKQAFLPRDEARKNGDLGVENASAEAIRRALAGARCVEQESAERFTNADLDRFGLRGSAESAARRAALGAALGIGYANAGAFLKRLNHYGITREEFEAHGTALFPAGDPADQ